VSEGVTYLTALADVEFGGLLERELHRNTGGERNQDDNTRDGKMEGMGEELPYDALHPHFPSGKKSGSRFSKCERHTGRREGACTSGRADR
jgi:hypothetical protein